MTLDVTVIDEYYEDDIQSVEINKEMIEEIKKLFKHKDIFKLNSSLAISFVSYFPKLFIDGKYDEDKCYEYEIHIVLLKDCFYIQGYYYNDNAYNEVFCSDSVNYQEIGVEDD